MRAACCRGTSRAGARVAVTVRSASGGALAALVKALLDRASRRRCYRLVPKPSPNRKASEAKSWQAWHAAPSSACATPTIALASAPPPRLIEAERRMAAQTASSLGSLSTTHEPQQAPRANPQTATAAPPPQVREPQGRPGGHTTCRPAGADLGLGAQPSSRSTRQRKRTCRAPVARAASRRAAVHSARARRGNIGK